MHGSGVGEATELNMADPESGTVSAGQQHLDRVTPRLQKFSIGNVLRRISERSPSTDLESSPDSTGLRHKSSGAENRRAYELNSQADVLGKGCAAQVCC